MITITTTVRHFFFRTGFATCALFVRATSRGPTCYLWWVISQATREGKSRGRQGYSVFRLVLKALLNLSDVIVVQEFICSKGLATLLEFVGAPLRLLLAAAVKQASVWSSRVHGLHRRVGGT